MQEAKDEKNKSKNRTPLKSMTAADKQEQADAFKKQGNDAFKAGNYREAATLFSAALELTPRNAVRRSSAHVNTCAYCAQVSAQRSCVSVQNSAQQTQP